MDPTLRLLLVPGVSPGRWVATWRGRFSRVPLELVHAEAADQVRMLADGVADVGFVRLPMPTDEFHAIPLWTEATVVVVPRDHVLTAADEVEPGDLAGETLLVPVDDVLAWADPPGEPFAGVTPRTTAQAVELVAAGAGVLAVPMSLARAHQRKDVASVPLRDGPTSQVGLAWPRERDDDRIEDFVGVVRGRTANSSRGRRPAPGEADAASDPARAGAPRAGAARAPSRARGRSGAPGSRRARRGGRR
ncbi:transcriptional regulator, LysR family [Beutenbergia cavernae DSM 12333]|uniref:Transcriptional regulator, LysR family n=1 Tax=Beutenbergia cavernae (strain ATCC BAA-8 / DSM 12333 / CCUG 43141 / JCM 11478 / NBRC 16432 / NCIMB 13614 / HKI 0122) TaxID=471853 RepID=C5C5I3_BEUC1|nr:LysR family substrate-binding domain-containing protein [Beutenbergia cavernae]ACQ80174.1 transcriptional regulator, LysR family [Beutenbergia cavernae DSM 12333]